MSDDKLRGIYAAVITPVKENGAIDIDRYLQHARWLLDQGCHGLGVFGTTGETQCFSVRQRQDALEVLLVNGLPAERIILGVGCCAVADTVALAKHALQHGVAHQLCLPPFFYKNNSDEGLYRAFAEVIDAVADPRLRFYLYHFPQVSGVPVTKGTLEKLVAAHGSTVRGVKDSSGDLEHTLDIIKSFPSFSVFPGADQHLLDALQAGGAGTISAAANLNCAANRKVFDAFFEGRHGDAQEGMKSVSAVRGVLQRYPLIPAIKATVAEAYGDEQFARVRPPMVELDAATATRLRDDLSSEGFAMQVDQHKAAAA